MKRGTMIGIVLGAVIAAAGAFGVIKCLTKVPAGYVAVQYNMNGGVKDEVLNQGWHLVSPMVHTTLYTVGLEQSYLTSGAQGDSPYDESFVASSSEGKAITIDMTFTYQFDSGKVAEVFSRFKGQSGKEVRDSFIKPNIISWTKEVIARYKVSDILGSERANINAALSDYLAEKFARYGILISNASLINLEVDADTQNAINEKITAQQKQETQSIENQTAIDKAEADAKVKRTNAQAEADALLIEAQAKAEANKVISDSLTQELIESQKIDKWDGVLPVYGGEGLSLIINSSEKSEN